MSKILYYFTFGENSINCFEKNSCTLEINLARRKLTLKSLDRKTVLTTVVFDDFLQVKNHLYVFDLTHDNDIVIIFPEVAICSRVFNILNEKKIQTTIDSNDLFKSRFLKPFCRRYLASSSNELRSLSDEVILAFEGLKEEDTYFDVLQEQDRENPTVAETMQPQASESSQAYSSSDDDDDSDPDSEVNKELPSTSNDEIIRAPLFEHYMSKRGNLGLIIYSSPDKAFFYQLSYDSSHNYYRCYRCKNFGKHVRALLEHDEDGNEIILLRGGPHMCSVMNKESNIHKRLSKVPKSVERNHSEGRARLGKSSRSREATLVKKNQETPTSLKTRKRKHSLSTSQSKTIRPPMYKKAITEAGNPKLLVFASNDTDLSYQYLYHRSRGVYFCSGCKLLKNWNVAELHHDSDDEEYLFLRNQSHVCAPKLYFDTPAAIPRSKKRSVLKSTRRRTLEPRTFNDDTLGEVSSPVSKRARFSSENINSRPRSYSLNNDTEAAESVSSLLQTVKPRRVPHSFKVLNPEYVIRPGSYRFEKSKISKISNGTLIVTTPEGLEYRYFYNRNADDFRCARCYNRFRNSVTAIWCVDINGEEFLELGNLKMNHMCTLQNVI